MKQRIQILLLFACSLPLLVGAREETMEERKQRITRKYLQERVEISQGEMVIPDAEIENEEVLASEKFKEPQVDLQRQEPGAKMPPPRRPARPRAAVNRNWLLAEASSEEAEGDADPFALKSSKTEPRKQTGGSAWGMERDASTYANTQRETRFGWRSHDSQRQGIFGSQGSSTKDRQSGLQSQYPTMRGRGLFGRQPETQTPSPTGGLNNPFESTFNTSPFLRTPAQSVDPSVSSDSRKQQGYISHKTPFQTKRNPQQEQWGGNTKPRQEYRKQTNPFQKWKEQNPQRNDPLKDDAFITEMMPKSRR